MKSPIPAIAIAFVLPLVSSGEVREQTATLIAIESTAVTAAPPEAVYKALTRKISGWWDPAHTWSGQSENLSIEARAGGCFCEKLTGGGSVQHARVIWAQPAKMLRLEGALGPLQDMAVNGVLTFKFAPEGHGSRITMTYRVAGPFLLDASKLAPGVDQVLGGQLERLRAFVDRQR